MSSVAFSASTINISSRNVCGVLSTDSLSGVNLDEKIFDDDSARFWIWGGMGNLDISSSDCEGKCEGKDYKQLKGSGGCGVYFVNSSDQKTERDMSSYYGGKLKFRVRTHGSNADKFTVGIAVVSSTNTKPETYETRIPLSSGLVKNFNKDSSEWQDVYIELSTSTSWSMTEGNFTKTNCLFLFLGDKGEVTSNDYVDIDYVRWVKAERKQENADFNVTLKWVENNKKVTSDTGTISWAESTFGPQVDGSSYTVAKQYLELDYNKDYSTDSSNNCWYVQVYVDNGSSDRNGLFATINSDEYVLPMCWRASPKTLPYTDAHGINTLKIGEKIIYNEKEDKWEGFLYDLGSGNTNYYPWLYIKDKSDIDEEKDYTTVMSYKTGYQASAGVYWSGGKVNLYFGAKTPVALGGLMYTGNICVTLTYE